MPLRIYSPEGRGEDRLPGLIYFHGGGLVSGDLNTHDALCATLAHHAACRVVAVNYRLAPEWRYPAAHDDAFAAVLAIAANPSRWAIDPGRLGVGGDSAGGNLAATAAARARDAGVALVLQLLLCPALDPLGRTTSRAQLATGHLLEEATMARYWEFYREEGVTAEDARVAPLREKDFTKLPTTLIHTAEYDPLRDEGDMYAGALRRAGVDVRHTMHALLIHHFYGLGAVIPAGQAALLTVCAELRDTFAREALVLNRAAAL